MHENVLLTLAEVSVAFVGFSALVMVFKRPGSDFHVEDSERVRAIVGTGLSAFLFSILPFVFVSFDASLAATWRVCSGLQAIVHLAGAGTSLITARRAQVSLRAGDAVVVAAGASVILLLTLNATAVGFSGSFGPYLIGVMWLLSISAFMLSGLVVSLRRGE